MTLALPRSPWTISVSYRLKAVQCDFTQQSLLNRFGAQSRARRPPCGWVIIKEICQRIFLQYKLRVLCWGCVQFLQMVSWYCLAWSSCLGIWIFWFPAGQNTWDTCAWNENTYRISPDRVSAHCCLCYYPGMSRSLLNWRSTRRLSGWFSLINLNMKINPGIKATICLKWFRLQAIK